ncbi:flagellar basal body protein, partial [Clostridium sp.]
MNINNDSSMQFIKLGLDASALREKVIANNMANINTKEFKKSYVSFEENLTK